MTKINFQRVKKANVDISQIHLNQQEEVHSQTHKSYVSAGHPKRPDILIVHLLFLFFLR